MQQTRQSLHEISRTHTLAHKPDNSSIYQHEVDKKKNNRRYRRPRLIRRIVVRLSSICACACASDRRARYRRLARYRGHDNGGRNAVTFIADRPKFTVAPSAPVRTSGLGEKISETGTKRHGRKTKRCVRSRPLATVDGISGHGLVLTTTDYKLYLK